MGQDDQMDVNMVETLNGGMNAENINTVALHMFPACYCMSPGSTCVKNPCYLSLDRLV